MVLEAEYAAVSQRLSIVTDDGSYGEKALVTDLLRARLDAGMTYDRVFAVGPLTMVKFVSLLTLPYGIPTVVSLNPLLDRFFGEAAPSGRVLPEIFGSTDPTAAPSPQPVSGPHKKCNLFP
jgi:NAD(P)H-flavin reductase